MSDARYNTVISHPPCVWEHESTTPHASQLPDTHQRAYTPHVTHKMRSPSAQTLTRGQCFRFYCAPRRHTNMCKAIRNVPGKSPGCDGQSRWRSGALAQTGVGLAGCKVTRRYASALIQPLSLCCTQWRGTVRRTTPPSTAYLLPGQTPPRA